MSSMPANLHSYRAGAEEALRRVKLAGVDWTSVNPLRWFEGTEPYADAVSGKIRGAGSWLRNNASSLGYAALGAGSLYAAYRALQAFEELGNSNQNYNAPIPQNATLRDYLEEYR